MYFSAVTTHVLLCSHNGNAILKALLHIMARVGKHYALLMLQRMWECGGMWNLWVCAWYATSAGQLQVSMLHDTVTSLMCSGLLCIVKLALQIVPASATAACHSCYRCPEVPAKS